MPSVASAAIAWLRGLVGQREPERVEAGIPVALDGAAAVAVVEASLSEVASLGGSVETRALAEAWTEEASKHGANLLGVPLDALPSQGPRGALAAAMGASLGGVRATAFLACSDLVQAQPLLHQAAALHLPLVVQASCEALPAQGQPSGSSLGALHAVADTGWVQLLPSSAQEAADLSLVARRVAEQALVPVMVAQEADQTAHSVQSLELLGQEPLAAWAGSPDDRIDSPTPAQRHVFGSKRRRVPRWHDLDRPTLTGAHHRSDTWAQAALGQEPFFHAQVPSILTEAMAALSQRTGRPLAPVRAHHVGDAEVVLVVTGTAAEVATTVTDSLRAQGVKVGVLALTVLSPFPSALVAEHLSGRKVAVVLESSPNSLAGDPPLTRLVRGALDKASENARFGPSTHANHPSMPEARRPRVQAVHYGWGGLPLRAPDLAALVQAARSGGVLPTLVGIDTHDADSAWPKRQSLTQALHQQWPHLPSLGLRSDSTAPVLEGVVVVGSLRPAGEAPELTRQLATLAHRADAVPVRGRLATPDGTGQALLDQLAVGTSHDPGSEVPLDVLVVRPGAGPIPTSVLERLRSGATVLLSASSGPQPQLDSARLLEAPTSDEALLGALLALLRSREVLQAKDRALVGAMRWLLGELPTDPLNDALDRFEEGLDPLSQAQAPALPSRPDPQRVPMAARHLTRQEQTADNLPRFWSQVGAPLASGAALGPDPCLSAGPVPPLSSTFRDLSPTRELLPSFDPAKCTGCAQCWSSCPDTALAPVVLSGTALVEAGLALAEARGAQVGALRQVASKLGPRVNKVMAKAEVAHPDMGAVLTEAWAWLSERLPMPDERKAEASAAFEAVRDAVAPLRMAVTEPFFTEVDRAQPGQGEALGVVVDPAACKQCGLCQAACEVEALRLVPQDAPALEHARRAFTAWEGMPDTSGAAIGRAWEHPDVSTLGALQLARPCLLAMAGGDHAEAGSGERLAARAVLAAVEFKLQPELQAWLKSLSSLQQRLVDDVRTILAGALPVDDLDALSRGLDQVDRPGADLRALLDGVESRFGSGRIDSARLERLVRSARDLAALQHSLAQGPDGLGRARASVVLTGEHATRWAATFPHNPFLSPVTATPSEALHLARGLAEATLRQGVTAARIKRVATAEVEHPSSAVQESLALASLTWRQLTADERKRVPRVVVLADEEAILDRDLTDLAALLRSDLPVLVVLLSPASLSAGRVGELGLLSMAHPTAAYVQGSPADPDHLVEGLLAALDHPGPALVRVHAPSPSRHGFPTHTTVAQAHAAIASRAFPLLRYVPSGASLGQDLDLDGNPDTAQPWSGGLTPAHWAATQGRHALRPATQAEGLTPLSAYLQMDASARVGRTPTLEVDGVAHEVPLALVRAVDERALTWRTLQELVGLETPFTQRIYDAVRSELEAGHQEMIEALRRDHETDLSTTRAEAQVAMAQRVHERLLSLAGYGGAQS